MLAPAHPQGAVIGATATLDQSHLISNEEFGVPLFQDVAFQFNVQVHKLQVKCAGSLERIHAVLEREKPAHVMYHLCILEPRMRVGFQARVGIDSIVGGSPASFRLSGKAGVPQNVVLDGSYTSRIGEESRVGMTIRLS